MKDIGAALVANLDLLTEFSRSVEATAEWWNHVKADLESLNPTLLPLEKGSSDASESFSKWAEMQQRFQQYHNIVRLYFCRRVLVPAGRASNLNDVALGELSARALPRTSRIFQYGLTIWINQLMLSKSAWFVILWWFVVRKLTLPSHDS